MNDTFATSGPDTSDRAPLLSSNLKVKVAWLYHIEGLTQEQVAERMKLSRVKVMRLLAESAADGLVITRINQVAAAQITLERRLERKFGFASAVVFPATSSDDGLEKALAYSLANVLDRLVVPGISIAVGSGSTLFHSLRHLPARRLAEGAIIGMVGALHHSGWINPSIVAMRLAEKLGLPSYQITAPVVVDDPQVAAALWRQQSLREVRGRALAVDLAVLTVGTHSPEATVFRHNLVPLSHFDSLREAGAVANMLCRFIDSEGHEIDHELNHRIMSIELNQVAHIPQIILAAAGQHRLDSIRAALRAVPVSIFVTDEITAGLLTAEPSTAGRKP